MPVTIDLKAGRIGRVIEDGSACNESTSVTGDGPGSCKFAKFVTYLYVVAQDPTLQASLCSLPFVLEQL